MSQKLNRMSKLSTYTDIHVGDVLCEACLRLGRISLRLLGILISCAHFCVASQYNQLACNKQIKKLSVRGRNIVK